MKKDKPNTISDSLIEEICARLNDNKQVRRALPEWGRVHIDRQLPFLCIYRRHKNNENSLSESLITGEASYLTALQNRNRHKHLSLLVKSIASALKEKFGSFLIVEVWASADLVHPDESPSYKGAFKIFKTKETEISSTIETLERSLRKINLRKEKSDVELITVSKITPPGLPALISNSEAKKLGCHIIGIEVSSIYHDEFSGQDFPLLLRKLKKSFSVALQNSFFEFTRNNTSFKPPNYFSLGRRRMVKAVWEADRKLTEISKGFDFLLQVSPVNTHAAWLAFKRNHFEKAPVFAYRPLTIDPALAKRKLFQIPIEHIEEPTLAQLFREQQVELDRKFTMLIDRETPRFLYGSLQLYGKVSSSLLNIAEEILKVVPSRSRNKTSSNIIDAKAFAARAEQELDFYRKTLPDIKTKVIIRNDITGLMVSQGNLLIGAGTKIPETRIEALIAHEVGTHVLTYLNGKSQPLQQLYIGLSGYDELQEGLAVLSEYLVDGLTGARMRLLAARVVAAHQLIHGANFVDVFRTLNKDFKFERRIAFNITTRTFRGGGLTKDAIYLRGLIKLLEYLKNGGELNPLFIGKISADHVDIVKELESRKVLHSAPLRPSYFENANINVKLEKIKKGLTILNLINRRKK